jgi:hypothetical protein
VEAQQAARAVDASTQSSLPEIRSTKHETRNNSETEKKKYRNGGLRITQAAVSVFSSLEL